MRQRFYACSLALGLATALLVVGVVRGQEDSEPWLARCMMGETSFDNTHEHLAMAWVLEKRWKQARKRFPALTFLQQVRGYCACLSGNRLWLRHLHPPVGGVSLPPKGWPAKAVWGVAAPHWSAALRVAETFRSMPDPYPQAMHWGGTMDLPCKGCVAIDTGGKTANTFYRLGARHESSRIDGQPRQ